MWEKYPDINKKIKRTETIIQEHLRSKEKSLEALLVKLAESGGKRLRPALTILSAAFGELEDEKVLLAAAGIEILHMATLVHDDIIDDADIRRGSPTINSKYGDKMAVYMGDYLFTRAVMLLSRALPENRLERIARSIKSICEAEVEQLYSRFRLDVSLVTYLKRIGRKTAALFSFSCVEGAFLSGCSQDDQKSLMKFGYYYGIAFQMQDDILNLAGEMDRTGKPKGNDIKEGVITLPFILALRKNQDFVRKVKPVLSEQIKQKDIAWLIHEIIQLGGIKEARHWIGRYLDRARKALEPLPDIPEKRILLDLVSCIGLA